MALAIKTENISKAYQLGEFSTGTITNDIERWWALMRGKEDPYLKVSETNDRSVKGTSDVVWSLKDINFEIREGEAVGIIGRNGAGKSTLLKILSKVTSPTAGRIKIKGRIASLLEVGTGFHPELTGKENIYLNGAILGMRKKEIKRKFDEIVDFSGVERYIDTPVKRYSSGMYVRLAFAVAAHLESEILIVDEVLAVGDADFQKKCLGKMNDVSKGDGRTVLFVSHQMGAIVQLCNRALLLSAGGLIASGKTDDVITQYLNTFTDAGGSNLYLISEDDLKSKDICFIEIKTLNQRDNNTDEFGFNESIIIKFKIKINVIKSNLKIGVALLDKLQTKVFTVHRNVTELNQPLNNNVLDLQLDLPQSLIAPNTYSFTFALFSPGIAAFDLIENKCRIKINDTGTDFASFEGMDYGSIIIEPVWKND